MTTTTTLQTLMVAAAWSTSVFLTLYVCGIDTMAL
jgi:hypothetical protein